MSRILPRKTSMPLTFRSIARSTLMGALAFCTFPSQAQFNPVNMGNFILSGPVDRQAIVFPIAFQGGTNPQIKNQNQVFRWPGCPRIRAEAWSDAPRVPGQTASYRGQPHSVFQIPGLPSIGYIIDVKDPKSAKWIAINDQIVAPSTQPGYRTTYESPPKKGLCNNVGLSMQITLVKLGRGPMEKSNRTYTVPNFISFRVSRIDAGDANTFFRGPTSASLSFNLRSMPTSCRLTSAAAQHITLPEIRMRDLPSIGSTYDGGNEAKFTVQCEPGVTPLATLTDASDPSNLGNILTNTGTAQGVGVQLLQTSYAFTNSHCVNNSTACRFGPDSSAPGNPNQWRWTPYYNLNPATTNPTLRFKARYIRTGQLRGGDVKATATITFSYQ